MKALVLLSGGLDSTTALALALDRDRKCVALSIHYGQRHEAELDAARAIVAHYGIGWTSKTILMPKGDSVLMHHEREMPHKSYAEIEGVSPTYVPFRNGTFLSLATAIALDLRCDEVWFGAHADDAENWAYPDCTPEFIGAMQAAIYVGTYHKVRLVAPWTYLTKGEIVGIGLNLNVPYNLTVSCYEGIDGLACGSCPTCLSRLEAFAENNAVDPVRYIHV